MRLTIDQRFMVIGHWNDVAKVWQWGVTDNQADNVHCGQSTNQLDMLAEATAIAKEWRYERSESGH
jgi:hypothetical protein